MSVVQLAEVKAWLDVTFSADDEKIQALIDAAEDEAKRYLDRGELPRRDAPCCECASESTLNPSSNALDPASDTADLAPLVKQGIKLLVQAMYDQPSPDEMEATRQVALKMMFPYRCNLGV